MSDLLLTTSYLSKSQFADLAWKYVIFEVRNKQKVHERHLEVPKQILNRQIRLSSFEKSNQRILMIDK